MGTEPRADRPGRGHELIIARIIDRRKARPRIPVSVRYRVRGVNAGILHLDHQQLSAVRNRAARPGRRAQRNRRGSLRHAGRSRIVRIHDATQRSTRGQSSRGTNHAHHRSQCHVSVVASIRIGRRTRIRDLRGVLIKAGRGRRHLHRDSRHRSAGKRGRKVTSDGRRGGRACGSGAGRHRYKGQSRPRIGVSQNNIVCRRRTIIRYRDVVNRILPQRHRADAGGNSNIRRTRIRRHCSQRPVRCSR